MRKRPPSNVPVDYSAYPGKSEAFVPNFLLKEWMVGAVVLVGFLVLAVSQPAPLGELADPTDTNFVPIPDWYFLFLYQVLKYPYFSGAFKVLGAVIVPAVAFIALLLTPFLDTGTERRWYRRPIASGIMLLTLLSMIYLTKVAWDEYIDTLISRGIDPSTVTGTTGSKPTPPSREPSVKIVDANSEGHNAYKRSTCVSCHAADLSGQGGLPALLAIGDKYSKEEILTIIHEGTGTMSAQYEANLSQGLTEEEIDLIAEWLSIQKK